MNPMFLTEVMDYTQPIEGMANKLSFAGMMVILGLLTVFAVLIVILLCLNLFKIAFHDNGAKSKASSQAKVEAPVVESTQAQTSDEEIIAVISAAIAMAESEGSGARFRVVSFRRV